MITHNEIVMNASQDRCFQVAADVERWPEILSHYRWVRFRRRDDFGLIVRNKPLELLDRHVDRYGGRESRLHHGLGTQAAKAPPLFLWLFLVLFPVYWQVWFKKDFRKVWW